MSSNPRTIFHYISMFALLMLLIPALHAQAPNQPPPPNLTCSPAPCVFPNLQVSTGQLSTYDNVIAVNPSNSSQMLVSGVDFNCNSVGIFSTGDGGTTWAHTCLPVQPGQSGAFGAIVSYDLNNFAYSGGIEDHLYNGSRLVVSSSSDNGVSWKIPVTVLISAVGIRWPWLEVDTNVASSFRNTIYVSATTYSYYFNSQITVSHSSDGGRTWNTSVVDKRASPLYQYYSDLAIGQDGAVYVTWARCKPRSKQGTCGGTLASFLISKSTDGGNTWSVPVEVGEGRLAKTWDSGDWPWGTLPNTDHAYLSNIPVVAVDNSSGPNAGRIYVAFYNYNSHYMQVGVVRSGDGGATWSAPVRVSDSNVGDEFFHWISVASDGTIAVTWLDRRNDPANIKYQPFFAISTDGGVTFSANRPLSTTMSDPYQDSFVGSYIGQNRTHVWVGNALYAAWMDTRTGHCQVELGGVQF